MHQGLAERLDASALKLNTQRQPAENIVELARNFGLAIAPTSRSGHRLHVMGHFGFRGIDHHGNLASALFTQSLVDLFVESLREKSSLQVTGIETNSSQDHPVV